MIAFQNVSFGYNRRRKVFADLSLTFGEGHIHVYGGCQKRSVESFVYLNGGSGIPVNK